MAHDKVYKFKMRCEMCRKNKPQHNFAFDEITEVRDDKCKSCRHELACIALNKEYAKQAKQIYEEAFNRRFEPICTECGKRDMMEFSSRIRFCDIHEQPFMCWSCKQKYHRQQYAGVYFIRSPLMNCIKIGFSEEVIKRLGQLQVGSADRLELVAVISQQFAGLEKELHKRFSHLDAGGEWFHTAPDLLECISKEAVSYRKLARM